MLIQTRCRGNSYAAGIQLLEKFLSIGNLVNALHGVALFQLRDSCKLLGNGLGGHCLAPGYCIARTETLEDRE